MTNKDHLQREFTLTWMLDAAPAEIFRAWTDPDHLDWAGLGSAHAPARSAFAGAYARLG